MKPGKTYVARRATSSLLISAMLCLATASFAVAADTAQLPYTKTPIVLHAGNVLPAKLLKGKNYTVKDRVENDGLINSYYLDTEYGPTKVENTDALLIRINELNAMVLMEEMERKDVFGKAAVVGVKAPAEGVGNLVPNPVKTTKGIGADTSCSLSIISCSITTDDPHQDNTLKAAAGYDAAKRNFAYELGIDPYSGYEPVVTRLGEIARASIAGGLLPKAALVAINSDMGTGINISSAAEEIRKLVRDNPPGELEKINRSKLAEMGIPSSLIDTFMDNYAYDPQEQTFLVGDLERLKGVSGREHFIEAAGMVTQRTVAVFYRAMAQLMAGYNTQVSPAVSLDRSGKVPYFRKKDGGVVVVLPLDFVFWTLPVANRLKVLDEGIEKAGRAPSKEFWITGKVDPGARKMLEAAGWKITENAGERLGR